MRAIDRIRVVLTRQRTRNGPWAERLRAAGLPVFELPLMRYEPLPGHPDVDPAQFDWILFTSPHGVRTFFGAGLRPGSARVTGLGAATTAELAAAGYRDALNLQARDGVDFAHRFLSVVPRPGKVLLPGPETRLPDPGATLVAHGVEVRSLALYRTCPVSPDDLPADPFTPGDLVFFCSPSSVEAFAAAYVARPKCVAIGRTTARQARRAGFDPAVADTPDLDAMVRAAGLDPLPTPTAPESGT